MSEKLPVMLAPCPECPFRVDSPIVLSESRVRQIQKGLEDDTQVFVCHKTLDSERKTCGGFLAMMKKSKRWPVAMRIAFALGLLKPDDVKGEELVYEDWDAMAKGHSNI